MFPSNLKCSQSVLSVLAVFREYAKGRLPSALCVSALRNKQFLVLNIFNICKIYWGGYCYIVKIRS